MAASVDMKIKILKKSMNTFSSWLDGCDRLVKELPDQLSKSDHAQLRELALKYKDLLLQMKERCAYMQEVNSLCKDVEQATMPSSHTHPINTGHALSNETSHTPSSNNSHAHNNINNMNNEMETADKESINSGKPPQSEFRKSKLPTSVSSPELGRKENGAESPSQLNPKLVDLATEVKDLNVRFATTCMQAKQHYASLSKALTASIERHSSLRSVRSSLSSNRSNRSMNGHYVRITHISERNSVKGESFVESGSSQSSTNSTFEGTDASDTTANAIDTANKQNDTTDDRNDTKNQQDDITSKPTGTANKPDDDTVDGEASPHTTASTPGNSDNPSTTISHNTASSPEQASSRRQLGGGPPSKASVYTTRNGSPPKLGRSSSVSTSTDIDSEIRSRLEKKYPVVLRRSISEYSDTQPRSGKRPKSAVIIEPKGDGEKALMSEVQLRGNTGQRRVGKLQRRTSMEIDLSSLTKSGLLLRSNFQQADTPGTPVAIPALLRTQGNPVKRKKAYSSTINLRAGDRSSVISIESLDPRAMIGDQSDQSSQTPNANVRPDLTSSVQQLPSFSSPEWDKFKQPHTNGNLDFSEERLQTSKRSMSMDVLAMNKNKAPSFASRLTELSSQLQEFVHEIAEKRKCSLQSLELSLQLGELKAMSSLLECHDLELTRYSAIYSPTARAKLKAKEKDKLKKSLSGDRHLYKESEINSHREEISKLQERVGLLRTHCDEATEQTEEVLEFVVQYEKQVENFKRTLDLHTRTVDTIRRKGEGYSEDNWIKLSEAFASMTEQKAQLQSICELSNHLLYLEPIFSGVAIREELTRFKAQFQKLVLDLFSQLELQAKNCTDQMLLEMSVLESWIVEAELTVQALTKRSKKPNGVTAKLIDTRTKLLQELQQRKVTLESISEKIQPISLVLNPTENKALGSLIQQLEKNSKSLQAIETELQGLTRTPSGSEGGKEKGSRGRGSMFRALYGGKKQDKVQDVKTSYVEVSHVQDKAGVQDKGSFQDKAGFQDKGDSSDDEDLDTPYARIDNLQRKILQGRNTSSESSMLHPPNASQSGRPLSISGQVFSLPSVGQDKPPSLLKNPGLYERVEDAVPSPFLDYDMVPSRQLDRAIEQLPYQQANRSSSQQSTPYSSPVHSRKSQPSPSHQVHFSSHVSPSHNRSSTYDIPPSHHTSSTYDIPPSHISPSHHISSTYHSPPSHVSHHTSSTYDIPPSHMSPSHRTSSTYHTPPSHVSPSHHSTSPIKIPSTQRSLSYPASSTYNIPPSHANSTYDIPPSHHSLTSLSYPSSSTYDIPPSQSFTPSHYATPASVGAVGKKIRYAEIDVSIYDNPRLRPQGKSEESGRGWQEEVDGAAKESRDESRYRKHHHHHRSKERERKRFPHEEILLMVGQEWKDLAIEVLPTSEDQLESAMDLIPNAASRAACKEFLQTLEDMEDQLKGVKERVFLLKPPRVPDLEVVHASIDQCQKLRDRLDQLHSQVENSNQQCLELTLPLRSTTDSASRAAQLVELRQFDVSTLWHMANMEVATCMRELRDSESSINSLHRQLRSLSRMLSEARAILEDKQNILDLEEYLKSCETVHSKLISRSDKRAKVSADIKESILHNPQAKVCQELLDQLREVETKWVNVSQELSAVPSLEPLLLKRLLHNASREGATLGACLQLLGEEKSVDAEKAKANNKTCQESLEKAKQLDHSLAYAAKRLQYFSSLPSFTDLIQSADEEGPSSLGFLELSGVTAFGVTSTAGAAQGEERSSDQDSNGSVDYEKLLVKCSDLKEIAKKLVSELAELSTVLMAECELAVRFEKEYEELHVWLTDTRSMLEVTGSPSSASGSIMGVPASAALLRGKHQAICQQVVTRQPKMELLHSLAAELIQVPSNPAEKQQLEGKISALSAAWDELCQQCVPAGVLPLVTTPTGVGGSLKFQPPQEEFEDLSQMLEWLILIESKLQPVSLVVGDFVHLRKQIKDLQGIENELKVREKDYKRLMEGIEDSEEMCCLLDEHQLSTSSLSIADPNANSVNSSPSKSVKFHDENTLERNLRQKEIQTQIQVEVTGVETSGLDSPMTPYHSVGPQRDTELESDPNLLDTPVAQSRTLQRLSSDPECSMRRMMKSLGTKPLSAIISEEHFQVALLWKGIWTTLLQEKKRLETVQERWKNFEMVKEEFSKFLHQAEERMACFFRLIGNTKHFGVIQTEMVAQKMFDNELSSNTQRLATLNNLSHELTTRYHQDDDTRDLQEAMRDLNSRWKKMLESVTPHQPKIAALSTRWAEFYREFLSFEQTYRNLDIEMSNLNPYLNDMAAVKVQLEKLKLVEREVRAKEGTLDTIHHLAMKLIQGVGGDHINAEGVHARLDNMTKRWKHLQTLAVDRQSALEGSLSEKQDFVAHLANCLAWLTQAEKHLRSQKPLGTDYSTVSVQHDTHQEFWREVQEQRPKMESVIASGRQGNSDRLWPQEAAESMRSGYSGMESRWKWVWSEAEDWGKLLNIVLPEMEKFQGLFTECGRRLSGAEMTVEKFEPVSRKIPTLKRQLDMLQVFEKMVVNLGDSLGVLVGSQKRQLELGVRKSPELFQLVKDYYQRWNSLKNSVEKRHADIEAAMIKYDPENIGVSTLPRGWIRRMTKNQVPYYLNTESGTEPKWVHPDLQSVYAKGKNDHTLSSYPSSAYPVALRLRAIQNRTQLSLLKTRHAMEAYEDHAQSHAPHATPSSLLHSPYETTLLAVDLFQKLEEEGNKVEGTMEASGGGAQGAGPSSGQRSRFFINTAVELTTCWIRDTFDEAHEGMVRCSSIMLAIIALSSGKLEEKYTALFTIASGGRSSMSLEDLVSFMEQIVQVPQLVCEDQFCSLHAVDVCARECFKKFVGVGRLHLPQFISWLQTEPLPLSWFPVLHRLAAAESSQHDAKCGICKTQPICGFRYRCIQCSNLDMCQKCYWSGKTTKGHDKSKHYMEEYCLAAKSSDEMKDFFKSLQRSFRRKKKPEPSSDKTQRKKKTSLAPTQVGGTGLTPPPAPTEDKTAPRSSRGASPPTMRSHSLKGSSGGGERHPGRRFTVTEDMASAWRQGRQGAETESHDQHRSPKLSSSTSFTREGTGHAQNTTPLPQQDMEASITKIAETTKNLSNHLKHMKELRLFKEPAVPPSAPQSSESNADALKQRNSTLQGRVRILQEHNKRLESCIAQLKLIAEVRQQQQHFPSPPQARHHITPHGSPRHHSTPFPSPSPATLQQQPLSSSSLHNSPPLHPAAQHGAKNQPSFSNSPPVPRNHPTAKQRPISSSSLQEHPPLHHTHPAAKQQQPGHTLNHTPMGTEASSLPANHHHHHHHHHNPPIPDSKGYETAPPSAGQNGSAASNGGIPLPQILKKQHKPKVARTLL